MAGSLFPVPMTVQLLKLEVILRTLELAALHPQVDQALELVLLLVVVVCLEQGLDPKRENLLPLAVLAEVLVLPLEVTARPVQGRVAPRQPVVAPVKELVLWLAAAVSFLTLELVALHQQVVTLFLEQELGLASAVPPRRAVTLSLE